MMARRNIKPGLGAGLGRRAFLTSGATLAGVAVVGCDALSTEPEGNSDDSGDGGSDVKESPVLKPMIESGEIPALEERLPENPLVLEPVDRVGVYGGDWNTAMAGTADGAWLIRTIGYDNLMRWNLDFTEPIPNLAESIDVADGGREYTINLRPGLKWSDGEPFTADDILFAYNDIIEKPELIPAVPSWLQAGGEPATFEKSDDETVVVRFAAPHGLFLSYLATPSGTALSNKPAHYLNEFHADYNTDVQALVDEAGLSGWVELFDQKAGVIEGDSYWQNPDMPVVTPWHIETPPGAGTRVIAERNPFYWKTDPDGRQLPYLDRVVYDVIDNEEVMLTRASNGEFDFHARHFTTLQNKPVLAQSREQGNYDFIDTMPDKLNELVVMLNLTHKDPVKREIFNNLDFRIGLSHAINRQELIDTVFQQQGEPWQVAPGRDDPYFDEEMAKQYTEYDVDLANEYLDKVFPDKNADGIRLGPDGKPISFIVSVVAGQFSTHIDGMQLIRTYWGEVGVKIQVNPEDYGLWFEKVHGNDMDALVWGADPGRAAAVVLEPRWFAPVTNNLYMVAWRNWYDRSRDEAKPEEPPAVTKEQLELYDQFKATADEAEQEELFKEILQIAKEQFYAIGTLTQPQGYAIVRNDFHNVPAEMHDSWQFPTPAPTNPEQYFTEQES